MEIRPSLLACGYMAMLLLFYWTKVSSVDMDGLRMKLISWYNPVREHLTKLSMFNENVSTARNPCFLYKGAASRVLSR
jgi:hypothetical protein